MRVTVNGELRSLPGSTTVEELLDREQAGSRLAIELNRQVVPRSEWSGRILADGDRIEIIHAIGGG